MQGFPTARYCLRLKLLDSNNFIPFHFHCLQVLFLWCGQPPSIKHEVIGEYAALGACVCVCVCLCECVPSKHACTGMVRARTSKWGQLTGTALPILCPYGPHEGAIPYGPYILAAPYLAHTEHLPLLCPYRPCTGCPVPCPYWTIPILCPYRPCTDCPYRENTSNFCRNDTILGEFCFK